MSKFTGVVEFKAGTFAYDVGGGKVATLDVTKAFPAVAVMEDHEVAAMHFAIKTAARNARAAIKPEAVAEAYEAVVERFASWADKMWRAASAATGEGRETVLARAVAESLGITPAEAAEEITALINAAIDDADLSRDEDADKVKIRKIGADCRENLKKACLPIYARLQAEEAVKRSEKAQAIVVEGPSLADLMKR